VDRRGGTWRGRGKKKALEEERVEDTAQGKRKAEEISEKGGVVAKDSAQPGKRMKRVFCPNLVVRGKSTLPAGGDGRPTSYWKKQSKGPLEKLAAQLGLKRVPTLQEYLKYTERDLLKVPSWTLPPRHDE